MIAFSAGEATAPSVVVAVEGQTPSSASFPLSANTTLEDQIRPHREGERRVPIMISSDQEYYWTHAWQVGEIEALDEINAGDTHVFADPEEAIRWLLSED